MFRPLSRKILVLAALVASPAFAADSPFWNFSSYGSADPAKLLDLSFDLDSAAEKIRIRSYVAAKAGSSREGMFARAWMAYYEGQEAQARQLYDDCVARYPKYERCLNNAVASHPDDAALRQRLLELAPDLYDFNPLRDYIGYLGRQGRTAEQQALVQRTAERYAGQWIAAYVHAQEAAGRGDRQAQRQHLLKAMEQGGSKTPFLVYSDLIQLQTGYFYRGQETRLSIATDLVARYLRETQRFDQYEPWEYLLDNLTNGTDEKAAVVQQFVLVYDRFAKSLPSPRPIPAEALDIVTSRGEGTVRPGLSDWLKKFRERMAARRATEPLVANALLWWETSTDAPLAAQLPQWRQLVAGALTDKDAVSAATSGLRALAQMRGDCAAAQKMAQEWDGRLGRILAFQREALEPALCVNDLADARRRIDAVASLQPKPTASDRSDRLRVAQAEAQAAAWAAQERSNPFLKRWDQKDDGRVALNIEFGTGSAVVPPRYADQLAQLARLLRDNGAEDYQFDIAGHTDARGSAALNQKLSEQRAQAVVDYLAQKHGIDRRRLTATGHGSAFPVASNASDTGMQQNRRVEISPRGSLRAPVLAQEGVPEGSVALSPDGRVLATAEALWDVKTRLKLRELPSASVRRMDFLPNGRVLVRLVDLSWPSTSERALEMVDVASGLVMRRQLVLGGMAESYAVSPDGRRLAMVNNGQLQVYAVPTLRLLNQRLLSPLASVGQVAWVGNERLAAAVRYGGQKLHLLDAGNLSTQKVFEDIDYVHTLGVSSSGKTLLAITNDGGELHAWDTSSWAHRSQRLGVYATRFVFHPFDEKALMDQWNGTERKTRLLDLDSLSVTRTLDGISKAAFTPDGQAFFFAGQRYALAGGEGQPWNSAAGTTGGASFGAWMPKTGQFMTDDAQSSQLWDVASGRQIDRLVGLRLCGPVDGSPDLFWHCNPHGNYDTLVEAGSWRRVPSPDGFKATDRQAVVARTATRHVVFESGPVPSPGRVAKSGRLMVVERASGRILATHELLLRQEDPVYAEDDALHAGGVEAAIDPSGRYVALRVWWKEHWGYRALSSKQVWLYDLQTGRELDRVALAQRAEKLSFAPGASPRLRIGFDTFTGVYDLARKAWEPNENWSSKESLLAEADGLRVLALDDKLTVQDGQGTTRYVFARKRPSMAGLFPAQNLLLLYYGQGEYDYYDLKTLHRQLTLHARGQAEWLAYAPSGEFTASLKGTEGYYWALGDKYLPFAALRERFERPEVIGRQLQGVVRGTASAPQELTATSLQQDAATVPGDSTAAAQKPPLSTPAPDPTPAIQADLFLPPFGLRVIDAPSKATEPKLMLRVGITKLRAIGVEPEVELNLNGQQVRTRGLSRPTSSGCDPKALNCEQVMELPINLDEGRNVVQVSLLYRNARLETKTAVVELTQARKVGAAAPRLYLFAAGVSQYAEGKQNLRFAHRDAEELAKAFKAQEGRLYSQVFTKVLTNAQVQKGSLDTEVNRFLRQASEQDLIVILLAGHGVQDNDQTLYFMTHDALMDEPYSGLDVSRIRSILRARPANQKALMLLDICHAGALGEGRRGNVNAEDAIKQLTQGTGLVVLSSSTGRELSNEAEQYRGGHGAFTAAVLEGLEGAADRDAGNRDGLITIQELTTYVMRRVPELTRNAQHPTTPSTERLQDFPLAAKP